MVTMSLVVKFTMMVVRQLMNDEVSLVHYLFDNDVWGRGWGWGWLPR